MTRKSSLRRLVLLASLGLSAAASAAGPPAFPPEGDWTAFPCRGGVMVDRYQDAPGFLLERDLVGDARAPAGFHAADADYLYLRLRLDADPAPGGTPRPYAWGIELDSDGNTSTYEVLIIVNGTTQEVALHRNTVTTLPDDPNDPADAPPLASYAFAGYARSLPAAGSLNGANPDFFLDFAVPWTDLARAGITPSLPVTAWAGSSSATTSLNGDLACHDGGTGGRTLSGTAPSRIGLDPLNGTLYEGGGGCAVGGGGRGRGMGLLTLLVAAAAAAARSRRLSPR